jgi:hypothetical protein
MIQVAEHLPSKHKALSSKSSTIKNKQKDQGNTNQSVVTHTVISAQGPAWVTVTPCVKQNSNKIGPGDFSLNLKTLFSLLFKSIYLKNELRLQEKYTKVRQVRQDG